MKMELLFSKNQIIILKYLYTGIISFDKQNGTQVLSLLIATDELKLQKLTGYVQTCLIDNQAEYIRNDPVGFLQIVFKHEACENLREFCLGTIRENPKMVFESPKFTS